MSSDSQPSFRVYFKNKVKKVIKPNITLSIRERVISNETYHNIRDKYHNFTDNVKEQTHFNEIKNKTKGLLPGIFSSSDNQTSPKGFYDSLFSPQIEEDVYIKVAIICLWIIALLCIIPTIITIFIPDKKKPTKTIGAKMIFFHILLCEFFYLIYILLSMINVAQNFQLNSLLCDIANYGMYVTIPVMHFALLLLSIERIAKFFGSTNPWINIFTKTSITQIILVFIWLFCIAIIATIMSIKAQFNFSFFKNRVKEIASPLFDKIGKTIVPSYQCSIDGRLSSIFKILFIILFIILLVLIIKAMIVSIFYNFFTPTCCITKGKKKKTNDHSITLLYIIFILLNLLFSSPFYFVSMANSIYKNIISTKDTFSMKLKICFILRISSIILQCLTFYTLESNSWRILRKLLFYITCKKFSAFNDDNTDKRRSITGKKYGKRNYSDNNKDSEESKTTLHTNESGPDIDTDTNDDEVFLKTSKNEPINVTKIKRKIEVVTDEDDDEIDIIQERKLPIAKTTIISNSHKKRDKIEEEKVPIKSPTSKYNNTNGLSKQIPNGKSVSQRISSTTNNLQPTKSKTSENNTKHHSIPHRPSSSSDEISSISANNSDHETKPSTTTVSKIQPTIHSSSNEQKRTASVPSNVHHSHHQRHRIKHSQSFRSTTIKSNPHHTKTTQQRRKSSTNANNHTGKSKQDRRKKIFDNSDEV